MTTSDFKFLYKYFAIVYIPAIAISYIFQYTVYSHNIVEALNGAINLAFVASFMSGFTTIWQKKRFRKQVMDFIKNDLPTLAATRKNAIFFVVTGVLLHIIIYSIYKLIMEQGLYIDSDFTFYAPFNLFLLIILSIIHYRKTKKLISSVE